MTEVYLELSRTSAMKLAFNRELLSQKTSIVDVWLGSKYASAWDDDLQ